MPRRATLKRRFPGDNSVQRPSIQLVTPDTQAQINTTRLIFSEYAEQLGVDLCFQNFDAELADLPGEYVGPHSVLLDTPDDMESARALYVDLGFTSIAPYYHNPIAGAHYLKADI